MSRYYASDTPLARRSDQEGNPYWSDKTRRAASGLPSEDRVFRVHNTNSKPVSTSDISQRPAVSGRSPLLNPESDGTFLFGK